MKAKSEGKVNSIKAKLFRRKEMSKLISPYSRGKRSAIPRRSGYQIYTREQLEAAGMDLSELPVKDVYTEYRPPAV